MGIFVLGAGKNRFAVRVISKMAQKVVEKRDHAILIFNPFHAQMNGPQFKTGLNTLAFSWTEL